MLPIPDDVYERARTIATAHEQSVEDVLIKSIVWDTDSLLDEPHMTEEEKREEAAFIRLHPHLRERFADQYVAIFKEQLVDHDPQLGKLYQRIRQRYGNQFVWIAPVLDTPHETWTVYSPRLSP